METLAATLEDKVAQIPEHKPGVRFVHARTFQDHERQPQQEQHWGQFCIRLLLGRRLPKERGNPRSSQPDVEMLEPQERSDREEQLGNSAPEVTVGPVEEPELDPELECRDVGRMKGHC